MDIFFILRGPLELQIDTLGCKCADVDNFHHFSLACWHAKTVNNKHKLQLRLVRWDGIPDDGIR